jgi:hypothetical protein
MTILTILEEPNARKKDSCMNLFDVLKSSTPTEMREVHMTPHSKKRDPRSSGLGRCSGSVPRRNETTETVFRIRAQWAPVPSHSTLSHWHQTLVRTGAAKTLEREREERRRKVEMATKEKEDIYPKGK